MWRCELQFKIYKRAGTVQKDNSKTTADTSRLYGNHSSLKSLTETNLWLNRNYSNTTKEMCITERTSRPFYSYTQVWNHRSSPKELNFCLYGPKLKIHVGNWPLLYFLCVQYVCLKFDKKNQYFLLTQKLHTLFDPVRQSHFQSHKSCIQLTSSLISNFVPSSMDFLSGQFSPRQAK